MSLSEFIRCMVQAGRRKFALEVDDEPALADEIAEVVEELGHATYDELASAFDVDADTLDDAILELQEQNRLTHNPRKGRYEPATET